MRLLIWESVNPYAFTACARSNIYDRWFVIAQTADDALSNKLVH
jgi:hypothetical protein